MRNALSTVPKSAQDAVAAIVRTIFSQPDHHSPMTQLHEVAGMLAPKFPQAAELLEEASEHVLAHEARRPERIDAPRLIVAGRRD